MTGLDSVPPKDEDRLPTGLRTLSVIEALVDAGVPLTPTAINERLHLPKATIHRICQRLEDAGWLVKDMDGKRLLPGPRLQAISTKMVVFARFAHARVAILRQLSEEIGETCNITIPERDGMTYLDRVETRWPLRIQLPVGVKVPFYCSASGKLYLSTLRKSQQQRIVHALTLDKMASNTITDPDVLIDALVKIRKERVGTDNQELVEGMVAVAVPIDDDSGRLVATLAVHGPTHRMTFEDVQAHVPKLRRAAVALSQLLIDQATFDDEWESAGA